MTDTGTAESKPDNTAVAGASKNANAADDPACRRQHKRVNVGGYFAGILENKRMVEGTVGNISTGGMYIQSQSQIPRGSVMLIEAKIVFDGQPYKFHLRAEVMHVTILSCGNGYGMGIRWVEQGKVAKRVLAFILS